MHYRDIHQCGGLLGHLGLFEFINIIQPLLGKDVDGLVQAPGGHVLDKLTSLFGIDHGVLARAIDRLVRWEHNTWRVKGQVVELRVWCQTGLALLVLRGDPANWPWNHACLRLSVTTINGIGGSSCLEWVIWQVVFGDSWLVEHHER